MHGVIGVGYEGREVEEFVDELRAEGVTTLADVRLNPISRKRGFSRRVLAAALERRDIGYVHLPQLGNPRDNRAAYAEPDSDEGEAARARFRSICAAEEGQAAMVRISELADRGPVAVMCFEADESRCHRREVLEALRAFGPTPDGRP